MSGERRSSVTGSSSTDAELVAASVGGDHDAFAVLYDRYADRVFSLCLTLTRDRGLAEDALADTFLAAWQRLAQLRDRTQVRPWLFAIARNRVARTGARAARQVPSDPFGADMRDLTTLDGDHDVDVVDAVAGDEAVALVWEAAAGLNDNERAVLELSVRQGVEGEELAAALGVTRHNANVIATRMRRNLERSIGALYLLRYDDGGCAAFTALVDGWSGALTPLWRKRISRHADECEVCDRRRAPRALAIFGESPVSAAPIAARSAVLGALGAPGALAVGSTGAPFRAARSGFPANGRSASRILLGLGVIVVTVVLLVGGVVMLRDGSDHASSNTAEEVTATTSTTSAPVSTSTSTVDAPIVSSSTTGAPGSSSTTTTIPPDSSAPVITAASITPTSLKSGAPSCTAVGARTAVLTVMASDDRAVVGGSARATINAGGTGVSVPVNLTSFGSSLTGTVGPFVSGLGSFHVVDLTVLDAAGNRSAVWTGMLVGGVSC